MARVSATRSELSARLMQCLGWADPSFVASISDVHLARMCLAEGERHLMRLPSAHALYEDMKGSAALILAELRRHRSRGTTPPKRSRSRSREDDASGSSGDDESSTGDGDGDEESSTGGGDFDEESSTGDGDGDGDIEGSGDTGGTGGNKQTGSRSCATKNPRGRYRPSHGDGEAQALARETPPPRVMPSFHTPWNFQPAARQCSNSLGAHEPQHQAASHRPTRGHVLASGTGCYYGSQCKAQKEDPTSLCSKRGCLHTIHPVCFAAAWPVLAECVGPRTALCGICARARESV